jgi:hypothetical protein
MVLHGPCREGYWTYETFKDQVEQFTECFEYMHPHEQLLLEVDQSSGHCKGREDGLMINSMSKGWGGKQNALRCSIIPDESCLGPGIERCLEVGDEQSFIFLDGERPFGTKYDHCTPHDRFEPDMSEKEVTKCRERIAKAEAKAVADKTDFALIDRSIMVKGFLGQPKGIEQILRERGKWTDDMILSKTEKEEKKMILAGDVPPDPSRYCDRVLAACTDFRLEISALDSLLVANGHLILKGVKCHPEMAGCGVEYIFGSSKRYFRKESDCQASTLNARVMASFQLDVIPLARIWKFERRARLYMLMYRRIALEGADADLRSYEELEKRMASMKSTHRNILEIESSYLKRLEALQELQRGREHVQQEVAVGLIAAPLLAAPQQAVIAAPLLAAPLQAVALINNEEGDLDLWANLDNEEEVGEEAQEE